MRHLLLSALLLGACPVCAEAVYLGTTVWQESDVQFGGFSAIHLSADGLRFIAINDRAVIVEGTLTRQDGLITGVTTGPLITLKDTQGDRLRAPRTDSEGLAVGPGGMLYISFEAEVRVRQQQGPTGIPSLLPNHPDFAGMPNNSSLEALAIGPDGALYTIPERSGRADIPFPVYRFRDGAWDIPFSIPRIGPFLVSGADIGPDGRLYVLERDFLGIGFRSRLRRFDLEGGNEELLFQTSVLTHDNLEGVSVWRDADGALRATLVSDDNFRFLQQTEIVEYLLPD